MINFDTIQVTHGRMAVLVSGFHSLFSQGQ